MSPSLQAAAQHNELPVSCEVYGELLLPAVGIEPPVSHNAVEPAELDARLEWNCRDVHTT